ncbi:MAG: hypothetical protein H6726_19175 [Sandaracinaceae bacterium]|nr:hypothetical protein [Sandaracinaceae bacterium]
MSAYAGTSALLLARRFYTESRAEAWLAGAAIWLIGILAPIHALGWLGQLTPGALGVVSVVLSSATLALALRASSASPGVPARRALWELAALPRDAFVEAWRTSPLIALGLAAVVAVCAFTAVFAYLAPSCSWDGVWYHESIVGFAIQEHGFAWVDVPPGLEYVNGYPKSSELLSLWSAIFSGRRTIEAVQSVMALVLLLGVYGLAQRFTSKKVHALGFAAVLVLTPAVALQLRSTLTDVCFVAMFTVALYFVTRPELRLVDLCLGCVAAGLLGSMKGTAIAITPLLLALAAARSVGVARRAGRGRTIGALFVSMVVGCALSLPGYARNWQRTGNPLWPVEIEVAALDLAFVGPASLEMVRPTAESEIFAPPCGRQLRDTRDNGYGNVLPFVLPLLVATALLELCVGVLRRRGRLGPQHQQLVWFTLVTIPSFVVSPAGWWWARLNLHVLVVGLLFAAYVVGREARHALADGVLGALILGALITLFWSLPAWDISWETAERLLSTPPEERDAFPLNQTAPPADVARARERELSEGAVVAYDGSYRFPAMLWNDEFSNRVVYLSDQPTQGDLQSRLAEVDPVWLVARRGGAWDRALAAIPGTWELVGAMDPRTNAYRRRRGGEQATDSRGDW